MDRVNLYKDWNRERQDWLKLLFQIRSSVVPAILSRVLFCVLFGVFITALHKLNFKVSLPILSTVIPSLVLSLLLVFGLTLLATDITIDQTSSFVNPLFAATFFTSLEITYSVIITAYLVVNLLRLSKKSRL
jgi:hypothetical protein